MSDTITLYEKCIHDRLEPHTFTEHYQVEPSRLEAGNWGSYGGGSATECPGGRKRTFRRPDTYACHYETDQVWVEVSDVE